MNQQVIDDFAKLDLRVAVLEEKVKTLFDLLNKRPHNG